MFEREKERKYERKKEKKCVISLKFPGGLGLTNKFECYNFEICKWKNIASSEEKRRFAALTSVGSTTFVIGGEKSSENLLSSIIKLDEEMVFTDIALDIPISRHCAVPIKNQRIFLIGGHIGSSHFSDQTLSYDIKDEKTNFIPAKMNKGRQLHSCAMFDPKTIIVVGGRNQRGGLKSVETFDVNGSNKWIERKNLELELELGISYAELVSHPKGKQLQFKQKCEKIKIMNLKQDANY